MTRNTVRRVEVAAPVLMRIKGTSGLDVRDNDE